MQLIFHSVKNLKSPYHDLFHSYLVTCSFVFIAFVFPIYLLYGLQLKVNNNIVKPGNKLVLFFSYILFILFKKLV